MNEGLGSLIKRERQRIGLTQKQLADLLGPEVDRSYISQIETGARKWPQELIAPLSKALAISELRMAEAAGLITVEELPEKTDIDPSDPREQLIARVRALPRTRGVQEALEFMVTSMEKQYGPKANDPL